MKKFFNLLMLLLLAVSIGFMSCSSDSGGSDPDPMNLTVIDKLNDAKELDLGTKNTDDEIIIHLQSNFRENENFAIEKIDFKDSSGEVKYTHKVEEGDFNVAAKLKTGEGEEEKEVDCIELKFKAPEVTTSTAYTIEIIAACGEDETATTKEVIKLTVNPKPADGNPGYTTISDFTLEVQENYKKLTYPAGGTVKIYVWSNYQSDENFSIDSITCDPNFEVKGDDIEYSVASAKKTNSKGDKVKHTKVEFTAPKTPGEYKMTISASCGEGKTASAEFTLTVTASEAAEPSITTDLIDAEYIQGNSSTPLAIEAKVLDAGTLSYEWYKDGEKLSTTGNSCDVSTVEIGDFEYYVVVTNSVTIGDSEKTKSKTSRTAKITVKVAVDAATPQITKDLDGTKKFEDDGVNLTVKASVPDGGTLTYVWYKKSGNGEPEPLSGAAPIDAGSRYIVETEPTEKEEYYCIVTNNNASATGNKVATTKSKSAFVVPKNTQLATINITAQQPVGKTNATSAELSAGISLSVTATSSGTITYQWYKDGAEIPGGTNATYTAREEGDYYVVLSVGDTVLPSSTVSIKLETITVSVTATKNNASKVGESLVVTATATPSDANISYVWRKDGEALVNTGVTYTAAEPGTYSCTVTAAKNGVSSSKVTLNWTIEQKTVEYTLPKPVITKNADGTLTCARPDVTPADAQLEYRWFKASDENSGDDEAWVVNQITVTPDTNGHYICRVRIVETEIRKDSNVITVNNITTGTESNYGGGGIGFDFN